jgi:glyoxylase-like metal-dependent hydrolase (beta-lactamase superfamily II)
MGVTIIARDELRARLATGTNGRGAPPAALPMITYRGGPLTFHINGEDVLAIAVPVAHTDGDTMVRFPGVDVLMTGDFYRSVGYPNIDRANGGTLPGLVAGLNAVIAASGPNTKIVPGHGAIVDKTAVAAHRDMIFAIRDRVQTLIAQGKTQDEVIAAKPTASYDATVPQVGTTGDRFVGQLYAELKPAAAPGAQAPAPPPMSFFVTSAGSGRGANLGGLAGADRQCQTLATAVGAGSRTWHAYLSVNAANGQPAVNARDRIGAGPWYNAKGARVAQNVADLQGDTLEAARRGNNLGKQTALTENGEPINGVGDTPNRHDMLTGSQLDGTAFTDGADHTCGNWTSGTTGTAQLGHSDRNGGGNTSWNSAHPSRGCSQENLVSTGGAGLFYCFAIQ